MSMNYPGGRALPAGGAAGTVLVKASATDQDATWTVLYASDAGAPTDFVGLLYLDTDGDGPGDLYAWDGAAYVLVAEGAA